MSWPKRLLSVILALLIALTPGCANLGKRPVMYIPGDEKTEFIEKGDIAPFSGILLSPIAYQRTFEKSAEEIMSQ